ncbi:hypothetical protein NP233_g12365 [Leucocoprinus birnbaumii]|uniref:Uncharacterized protein n=1 Tax=Leucocoprinus birnbaumii TaxID=56174 RepID=A0AAD5VGF9_9AGAR|nr:hypothetical protein NP233_g12365 [Leucocoprinus birnbaumii]
MSNSDAYKQAMKQLQRPFNYRGMTTEETTRVYNAMSVKIRLSEEEFMAGVKKLADQAIGTDRTFEVIRRELAIVDRNDYKDKNGKPIAKLQPTWVKYQGRYIDLLWKSREAATVTEAYLRDLVNVVFPTILEEDSTYEDNVKDLKAFVQRRNPVKGKDQDDDFKKLQADVSAFAEKFSRFADDEGAKLSEKITALMNDIADLKKELGDLNRLVNEMGIAIGITTAAGAAGIIAIAVLGVAAATEAIILILVTGIAAIIGEMSQLIIALIRRREVEGEIADKEQRIKQLSEQQRILEELKAKLELCAEEGSDMFGRLANFSDMWSMCAQDAQSLIDSISDVHTDKGLQAKIQLMSDTYKSAADALSFYATCIDKSDVFPVDGYTMFRDSKISNSHFCCPSPPVFCPNVRRMSRL